MMVIRVGDQYLKPKANLGAKIFFFSKIQNFDRKKICGHQPALRE